MLPDYQDEAQKTLKKPWWEGVFLREDQMGHIKELRKSQRLLVYGSGQLVRSLFDEGLVDECRETAFPLPTGKGKNCLACTSGLSPLRRCTAPSRHRAFCSAPV